MIKSWRSFCYHWPLQVYFLPLSLSLPGLTLKVLGVVVVRKLFDPSFPYSLVVARKMQAMLLEMTVDYTIHTTTIRVNNAGACARQ